MTSSSSTTSKKPEEKSENPASSSSPLPASLLSNEEELKKRRERYYSEASSEMKSLLSEEGDKRKKPEEVLQSEKEKHREAGELLQQIEHLLSSKLYHEFTLAVVAYLSPPRLLLTGSLLKDSSSYVSPENSNFFSKYDRCCFFQHVIAPYKAKLDDLHFLAILSAVCEDPQLDSKDALAFLCHHYSPLSSSDKKSTTSSGSVSSLSSSSSSYFSSSSSSASSTSTATGMPSEAMRSLLEREIRFYSALSYHLTRSRDFLESEEYLDELKKKIDTSPFGIDAASQSAYHRSLASLARAQDKYADFYHNAIIFLAYTSAGSIPEEERVGFAYEIATAALISPDIFNFGEVMQQALILSTLKLQKEHNWLWMLLESFHYGSLPQFESVCENFPTQISSSALSGHMDCLKKKIAIAALVRLAFTRSSAATSSCSSSSAPPSSSPPLGSGAAQDDNMSVDTHANHTQGVKALGETLQQQVHSSPPHHSRAGVSAAWRTISFDVVKQTCKVEEEDVERLVMRAMSQKLLKGSIDQVNRQIFVTWIRPALLLDDHGLTCLQDRLVRWLSAAESLHQQLTAQTTELLGS